MHDYIMNCFAGTKLGCAFGWVMLMALAVAYLFYKDEIIAFEKEITRLWKIYKKRMFKKIQRRIYQWQRARQMTQKGMN